MKFRNEANKIVIVGAKRTPIGSFSGSLSSVTAPMLGAAAIKAALEDAGVKAEQVDECLMGNVLTAGVGQAPARQAAIFAGLPKNVPCTTVGKVCGSGLKAVMLGAQSIMMGDAEIVVAGGMENMSLAPYLLDKARSGYRMGHGQIKDSMIADGLWDVYNNFHMGNAAEKLCSKNEISKEAQDNFAAESYKRALKAQQEGTFNSEICAVEVKGRKGAVTLVESDEEPGRGNIEKLPKLRAAFDKEGTISAGNASSINDGAAAVVLTTEKNAEKLGLKVIATIVDFNQFAHEPEWFTTAPTQAMKRLLNRQELKADDVDLYEINEAFSSVTMDSMNELGIDHDRVNIYGGAVAIGHPIGASGCRILVTLLNALEKEDKRLGLASLCIGGGEAVSMLVERS